MSAEILAPVNAAAEVAPLVQAGASWLYGGCLPPGWRERFPATVPVNQRTFASAQFASWDELAEAVASTRGLGARFAFTLNAPFYMESQLGAVALAARSAAQAGAEALIVADPGLMVFLRSHGVDLPFHVSTMGLAGNAAAVAMYRSLGATRVILPRFLTLTDVSALVAACPGVEFEAFAMVGKCPNVEGVCSFLHDSTDGRWPCEWAYGVTMEGGQAPPPGLAEAIDGVRRSDRRDACALCAVPRLLDAGVSALKIVGRGAPLDRKTALVRALAEAIAAAKAGTGGAGTWGERCRGAYRRLFGHPCGVHNCYYPEASGD